MRNQKLLKTFLKNLERLKNIFFILQVFLPFIIAILPQVYFYFSKLKKKFLKYLNVSKGRFPKALRKLCFQIIFEVIRIFVIELPESFKSRI